MLVYFTACRSWPFGEVNERTHPVLLCIYIPFASVYSEKLMKQFLYEMHTSKINGHHTFQFMSVRSYVMMFMGLILPQNNSIPFTLKPISAK